MSPEELKPSEQIDLKPLLIIGGVFLLSQAAFTSQIRRFIMGRDKKRDVWDGSTENLECAHITHDRTDPRYNDPSNGRMLNRRNHYLDHYNRAGNNGLPIRGNDAALRLIWQRLTEEEREGLPPPPEEQTW
jgi:hypothetical protein